MSRQSHSLLALSVLAAATISAYRFIAHDGTPAGLAGDAFGVSQHDGVSGDLIATDVIGTTLIESGGVFGNGALLQSDASGRAVAALASETRSAVIAGGAAGDHTVTGIKATDRLVAVVRLDRDSTAANINLSQLTGEFSISADNTVNNAGGTATTGDALLVIWETHRTVRAKALAASTGVGQLVECLLLPG